MDTVRSKIMLVDDNAVNLTVGRQLLKPAHDVYTVSSAAAMFEVLHKVPIDLILLDVDMPQMDGYEAIRRLKRLRRFAGIPVIFLTALRDEQSELKGFDLGAVEYVSKPFSPPRLLKRIENQLLILRQRKVIQDHADNLEELVRKKTREVFSLQNAMLDTIADLVEFRGGGPSGGCGTLAPLYLRAMIDELRADAMYADEIDSWDMNFLYPAVQLHDVGKIAMPDSILNKQGALTPGEFEIMKTHVGIGVDVVKKIMAKLPDPAFMEHVLRIVEAHHEKWDGTGYPAGLKGEDIPLEGRVMAFADVYDALVSWRPYRSAYTHGEAVEIIRKGSGTQFDPSLMEVFLRLEGEFSRIAQQEHCRAL